MDKHKKKILILIGVVLAFISLIAIVFGIIFKDEEKNKPIKNPNGDRKVISKEIEELRDETTFFTLQNTINNYYRLLTNENTSELLNILDSDFKKIKNVTSNNIYDVINSDYETVTYVAKTIYYNPNSSITYYFINGYLTNLTMMEDDYDYYKSVNYLIVVDESSNYYNIIPLENDVDIENYAKNYNIREKEITSKTLMSSYSMSEKNKLSVYITEFLDLMIYDNERAYNMLDDSTKNKYSSYEDFKNQLMEIYDKLSTVIFGFSVKEVNGEKVYSIIDDKQNKITIYEKNTMNYKISY